jgi:DNA-directed RNA polymerase specialized sigma24 family protein
MTKQVNFPSLEELALAHEQSWSRLYDFLRPTVTFFVCMYAVSTWYGQENDLVEDVLQETAIRIYRQVQLAQSSDATPILHLESFCKTIARNYCRDLRRKEKRLEHFPEGDYSFETYIFEEVKDDPVEAIFETLFARPVIFASATLIASFPEKQRQALLIDLAQKNDFDALTPSLLEEALASVNINLRAYRDKQPGEQADKARHSSLVSIAYKRLRNEFFQQYAHLVA